MGKVVRFERRRRPVSTHPGARPEGRVLVFTGVRYDRRSEEAPRPPGTGAKTKHRQG